MSVISATKPDAWTLSPQMTAAPNLWRGCRGLVPLWENSGVPYEIINGKPREAVDAGGSVEWLVSSEGVARNYISDIVREDLEVDSTGIKRWPFVGPLTYAAMAEVENTGGSQTLFGVSDDDGVSIYCQLAVKGSGGVPRMVNRTGAFQSADGTTNVVGDGLAHVFVGTLNNDASRSLEIFLDGVSEGTDTSDGDVSGTDRASIGSISRNGANDNTDAFKGKLYWVAAWDRILSSSEIQSLSDDPFIMLRPAGF